MGRYSSVQAYADNNSNVRSISYEQATGSSEAKKGVVKTEKVNNPYGSTAGAGSGEFHVYRHARAREMERWKELDAEEREKFAEAKFQEELINCRTEEERKTAKKRRKRQREKEAKQRKKMLKAQGIDTSAPAPEELQAGEEEFTYVPIAEQEKEKQQDEEEKKQKEETVNKKEASPLSPIEEIPNDGSFLQMMKERLAAEHAKDEGEEKVSKPPPAKKQLVSKIIDEDDYDDEGPMLPPSHYG